MKKPKSVTNPERPSTKPKSGKNKPGIVISISSGTCGQARGSLEIVEAFRAAVKGHEREITVKVTGCHGFCDAEPNVVIFPGEIFYGNLKPEHAPRITAAALRGETVDDLLYREGDKKFLSLKDIPFYRAQQRTLLGANPLIDPTNIQDYLAVGGYKALGKALAMQPGAIIDAIKSSGLRGRGGAGFPTGHKWEIAARQPGPIKYVVCNGDEGDPGAYMDRSILESNPHLVIEGMIIGGFAMGASEGWIYVRNEYPLAVKNLQIALHQAEKAGLLGKNIRGSGFDFYIHMAKGAGAFVCGEETALIASIEGRRGIPSQRPPFPAVEGLFHRPTTINNVETWADVTRILEKGADWFAKIGTATSKGTKIFSLVGKVRNSGLVEVPMGITLDRVVHEIGGGAQNGKRVKAIQTGGPSGGCIPKALFHLAVDYESLTGAGAIMGSGGLIVMDEETCMVDTARYFTHFLQAESCGKCVTCREGTQRMHEILIDITEGKGSKADLELLTELAGVVKDASLCGLGQTAPNPVLSTLRYFKKEYLEHIEQKKCRAGVCKALLRYEIAADQCAGCGICLKSCPQHAVEGQRKKPHRIIQQRCIKCGICLDVCRLGGVVKRTGRESGVLCQQ